MGRRKERRLAAISAAGRRVKLDLFAEPSGDLGDSSAQEGVGGDGDSRTRTELPSSPSSSGQQPQNPLLLLEQYSDEELEDDVTEGQNRAVSQGTSVSVDKEAIDDASENIEDIENNDGKEHNHAIEQILINDGSASLDPSKKHEEAGISGIDSDDLLQQQTHKMGETTNTSASDDHLLGVESSGWKMVLHEESNQYYYWNIVTGETSWEVPSVFTQETVTSVERADGCTEGDKDADLEMDKANVPFDIEEDDMSTRNVGVESKVSCQNCEGPVQGTEADGSHEEFKGGNVIDGEEARNDANQNHGNTLLGAHSVENRCGTEFPSQLIKLCEGMLERLKSVKGFSCYTEDKDLKFKFMLETEIRLADMKALASNGSSLITFWMHSEAQLKRLEAAVDDAINNYHSVSPSGLEDEVDSSVKKDISSVEPHAASISKSSNYEAHDVIAATEHLNSLYYSRTYADNHVGGKNEITVTEKEGLFPARSTHSGEDVDMDVDMEVDDTSIVQSHHGGVSGSPYHDVLPEPSSQHNLQAEPEASVPGNVVSAPPVEEWIPPPPPDSEPFPPPPPDDELFPPPPPDEPPETLYTSSSHLGSVQSFTYPEQYSTLYPGSGLEYYGQTNLEISASTIYTHPDGGQVAVSHLPHYYEAVPNLYGVTPLVVNPVDSAAYYGPQSASLSHVLLISAAAAETSITQGVAVPENQDSTKQGPLDSLPQDDSSFLSKSSVNATESGHCTVKASTEVPNAQPAIGAPSTSSMADDISISSASDAASVSSAAAAAAAAAAASKAQYKVSRSKKRTVAAVSSLRSNKKVSTMVDKWKAVKEELQEEEKEEEPEDPYEILEKKRQREIEEWRAQLIASGEAKDNANFQPLGGDWRERVKRRRAERMKEKKQRSPDITPPSVNQQQQVDLVELSKGIPSGWQAYWDESSKQVYYGNVLTSETTWTRPAD